MRDSVLVWHEPIVSVGGPANSGPLWCLIGVGGRVLVRGCVCVCVSVSVCVCVIPRDQISARYNTNLVRQHWGSQVAADKQRKRPQWDYVIVLVANCEQWRLDAA